MPGQPAGPQNLRVLLTALANSAAACLNCNSASSHLPSISDKAVPVHGSANTPAGSNQKFSAFDDTFLVLSPSFLAQPVLCRSPNAIVVFRAEDFNDLRGKVTGLILPQYDGRHIDRTVGLNCHRYES